MPNNPPMTAKILPLDEARVVCNEQVHGPTDESLLADKKAMEAELNELRYQLEQNVEQKTGQLLKRITVLESCKATLCDKLASAQRELAALTRPSARNLPGTIQDDCAEQIYASSDWTRNLIKTSAQDDWGGLVTTA